MTVTAETHICRNCCALPAIIFVSVRGERAVSLPSTLCEIQFETADMCSSRNTFDRRHEAEGARFVRSV